jgi:uncharacterized protein
MTDGAQTYLLVDGENIDGVLGNQIFKRRPEPGQRPRWQHVLTFAQDRWDQPVRALFFLNATLGLPAPFVQALLAIGYRPIPLAGRPDQKVVDIGIIRTLQALESRPGDVLLASHDSDFVPSMEALRARAERRIGVIGFKEWMSDSLRQVDGMQIFDLEDDASAFEIDLPRVRVIPLDEFDPLRFL